MPQFEESLHLLSGGAHLSAGVLPQESLLSDELARLDEALRNVAPLAEKNIVHALLQAQAPPHTHVASYGSMESGTFADGSDLDFTLLSDAANGMFDLVPVLRRLRAKALPKKYGVSIRKTILINSKMMSLVRFQVGWNDFFLECDLTHNNWSGIKNTCFIKETALRVPQFGPLCRLVKIWARSHKIGDRSRKDGVATYTLSLLVMRYLQMRNLFLPLDAISDFCQRLSRVGTSVVAPTLPSMKPIDIPEEPLGRLWPGFFNFVVSLQAGGCVDVLTGQTTKVEHSSLVVLCPITQVDVNPMTQKQWAAIHAKFVEMSKIIGDSDTICGTLKNTTKGVERFGTQLVKARADCSDHNEPCEGSEGKPMVPPCEDAKVKNGVSKKKSKRAKAEARQEQIDTCNSAADATSSKSAVDASSDKQAITANLRSRIADSISTASAVDASSDKREITANLRSRKAHRSSTASGVDASSDKRDTIGDLRSRKADRSSTKSAVAASSTNSAVDASCDKRETIGDLRRRKAGRSSTNSAVDASSTNSAVDASCDKRDTIGDLRSRKAGRSSTKSALDVFKCLVDANSTKSPATASTCSGVADTGSINSPTTAGYSRTTAASFSSANSLSADFVASANHSTASPSSVGEIASAGARTGAYGDEL